MEGIETSALTDVQLKAVQDDLGITAAMSAASAASNTAAAAIENAQAAKNTADEHIADKNNPHEVTKEQLGLDEVVNRGFDESMSLESENHLSNKVITANCNGAICTTASGASAKTIDIEGFTLFTGAVVRVLFMYGSSSENPTLNVNATGARPIKAVKGGEKIAPPVHSGKWRGASEYTNEAWQPYTSLGLIYDGTDWVIMGNPEVENYSSTDGGYSIKANGSFIKDYINTPYYLVSQTLVMANKSVPIRNKFSDFKLLMFAIYVDDGTSVRTKTDIFPEIILRNRNSENDSISLSLNFGTSYSVSVMFHWESDTSIYIDQLTSTWGAVYMSIWGLL